jgi:hypothetical protein
MRVTRAWSMALVAAIAATGVPSETHAEPVAAGGMSLRHETLAALTAGFRAPVIRTSAAPDDTIAVRSWADGGLKPLGHRLAAPTDLTPVPEPMVKLEPMLAPQIEHAAYVEPVAERPAFTQAAFERAPAARETLHGNPLRAGSSGPVVSNNPLR